jgi:hypothetical protein
MGVCVRVLVDAVLRKKSGVQTEPDAVQLLELSTTKTGELKMSFQKVLIQGDVGSVQISESGGQACISASLSAAAGGGNLKGVASVSASISVNVSAIHLMDAGIDLAASKFPQFAAEIALIKAALDAEAAKL